VPSVYGKSRREKLGCRVVKDSDHHKAISEAVELAAARRRPVMVYFDTIKAMSNLFTSEEFSQLCSRTSTLCETNDDHELKRRINFATRSGQITLLTKTFGRGVDFVVVENEVREKGGVHVIQTFISQEQSESVQIEGRTARQGERGSVELIVTEKQVSELGLDSARF
jgi:preprotein translocase subunit SecA